MSIVYSGAVIAGQCDHPHTDVVCESRFVNLGP